jgi:endogenous inhibitor of DNA gyrase (YacG/DUF329 family)
MTHHEDYLSYNFVMTISTGTAGQQGIDKRCRWCRHVLAASTGPGRPKEFCSQRCRQWDWVSRQRASELALSENELVMTRDELDALKDQMYVLHCALNDVQTDLASPRQTKESLLEMLGWLIQAAEPIAAASLTPAIRS